jgi:hypothetical protein
MHQHLAQADSARAYGAAGGARDADHAIVAGAQPRRAGTTAMQAGCSAGSPRGQQACSPHLHARSRTLNTTAVTSSMHLVLQLQTRK